MVRRVVLGIFALMVCGGMLFICGCNETPLDTSASAVMQGSGK